MQAEKRKSVPLRSGRSRTISVLAATAVTSAALQAYGQASGTWIPTFASTDWNTPSQWIGSVPNAGGVASFSENVISSPSATPTLSSGSFTLSRINIASSAPYKISASSGNGIIFPSTGGTINVTRSAIGIPLTYNFGGSSAMQLGSQISAPISGGSLTVQGGGAVSLTTTSNTYTGGTNVSNATLAVLSDGSLGNISGGVMLNNATLAAVPGGPGLTTSRAISISGTSSILSTTTTTFNGPVSGSGTLIYSTTSYGGLDFQASNSFSGNLLEAADTSGVSGNGIVVQGSGAFPNVSNIYVDSYFNLNNVGSATAFPRLNPNANVYLDGGIFRLATTTGQSVVETINNLNVEAGYSYIGMTNVIGGSSEGVTVNNLVESNGASLFVRGGNVTDGSISVTGNENFISVNDPGSIGGGSIGAGGTAGTTTLSIIPWIIAATGNTGASPTSGYFATRNASNGAIRPLAFSEMSQTLGNNASDNVYLTEAGGNDPQLPAGGATCNSITFSSNSSLGNVSLDSNGSDALTVNSGGVLLQYTTTINSPLIFPNGVTGYLQCAANLITTNTISGTGGVSKGFGYNWLVEDAYSTYSGPTYLNGGTIDAYGPLPFNAPSVFGMSTSPIYLVAGDQTPTVLRFMVSGDVDRQMIVSGNGAPDNYTTLYSTAGLITFNGNDGSIVLNRDLDLAFGNPTIVPGAPAANAIFNGVISGVGALVESGPAQQNPSDSAQILNAANTYSGGTILETGQFYAGNNSAFGTGPISFAGAGTIGATAGPNGTDTTRTLANNIVSNSGSITFNNAIPLTLTGSIELNGKNTAVIAYGSPTTLAGNIDSGEITLKAGNLTLSGSNTFTGGVTVTSSISGYPATITFATPGSFPAFTSLIIASGSGISSNSTAIAALHTGGTYNNLLTSSLILATNGVLDLTNNDLVVRGGSLSTIWGYLQSGYNGGGWNGTTGIISSTAAGNTSQLTSLGIMINDTGANTGTASGTALKSTLNGSASVDGDILVKYTYYGDANLDGKVDGSDYSLIDNGYLNGLTGWYNGDFNYDGVVNGSDYTLIDNAFNTQGTAINGEVAAPTALLSYLAAGGSSAVPEPASIALLGIGAAGLLGRRRRR